MESSHIPGLVKDCELLMKAHADNDMEAMKLLLNSTYELVRCSAIFYFSNNRELLKETYSDKSRDVRRNVISCIDYSDSILCDFLEHEEDWRVAEDIIDKIVKCSEVHIPRLVEIARVTKNGTFILNFISIVNRNPPKPDSQLWSLILGLRRPELCQEARWWADYSMLTDEDAVFTLYSDHVGREGHVGAIKKIGECKPHLLTSIWSLLSEEEDLKINPTCILASQLNIIKFSDDAEFLRTVAKYDSQKILRDEASGRLKELKNVVSTQ